jgi:hypothetical protein
MYQKSLTGFFTCYDGCSIGPSLKQILFVTEENPIICLGFRIKPAKTRTIKTSATQNKLEFFCHTFLELFKSSFHIGLLFALLW